MKSILIISIFLSQSMINAADTPDHGEDTPLLINASQKNQIGCVGMLRARWSSLRITCSTFCSTCYRANCSEGACADYSSSDSSSDSDSDYDC